MARDTVPNKILRSITASLLPIANNRRGQCNNCGKCCNLVYKCPFLSDGTGKAHCTIYQYRPAACKKYPRTMDEQVHEACGYYFKVEA